jgi:hypothetical protein
LTFIVTSASFRSAGAVTWKSRPSTEFLRPHDDSEPRFLRSQEPRQDRLKIAAMGQHTRPSRIPADRRTPLSSLNLRSRTSRISCRAGCNDFIPRMGKMPARVRTCHILSDLSSRAPRHSSVKHRLRLRGAARSAIAMAPAPTAPAVVSDPRAMREGEDGRRRSRGPGGWRHRLPRALGRSSQVFPSRSCLNSRPRLFQTPVDSAPKARWAWVFAVQAPRSTKSVRPSSSPTSILKPVSPLVFLRGSVS